MKYRILNNSPLDFYDSTATLIGTIAANGSNLKISSTSGVIELGNTATDIQVGTNGTAINWTFLGGGTIGAAGTNTLSIGQAGDTINMNVASVTYQFPSSLVRYTDLTASNNRINITTQVPGTINFSLPDRPVVPYLSLTGSTDATSNTTGVLQVTGGVGVTGNVYSGGLTISGSTGLGITFADYSRLTTANNIPSAFNQANNAFNVANVAFTQANNAASFANGAFTSANNLAAVNTTQNTNISSAQSFANGAFTAANVSQAIDNTQNTIISSAQSFANGSFTQANNAASFANGAFTLANNTTGVDTTQNTNISSAQSFANGAFTTANSAASFANGAFTAANVSQAIDNTQNTNISSAQSFANGAFTQANNAASFANGAFTLANNTTGVDNTQNTNISSAQSYANSAFTKANNALANTTGTFAGDLTITGNLFVNGTTTTVNTQTLLVGDNLVVLNSDIPTNVPAPAIDSGIEVNRGLYQNTQLVWSEVSNAWRMSDGNTFSSIASANLTQAAFGQANNAFNIANVAYIQANNAASFANGSFTQANNAASFANGSFDRANSAYNQANSAASFANGAFTLANNTTGVDNTQNTNISSAQSFANGAFTTANSAASFANGAFTAANVSQAIDNTQNTNISSAQSFANGAFSKANTDLANTGTLITANGSSVYRFANTTAATSATSAAVTIAGGLGVGGTVYADIFRSTNNGAGTNYYVGDDAIIGDYNVSNTLRIMGQQNSTQGYITFGSNANTNYIGRDSGEPIKVVGPFQVSTNAAIVSVSIEGYAGKGGVGYHDFLRVTNTYGSATNPNKFLRMNSTGSLEIINSAYTQNIFTLTDTGSLSVGTNGGDYIQFGDGTRQYTANSASGSATDTTARATAQAAFDRANSGYAQANSAASFANGAFTAANVSQAIDNTQNTIISSAQSFANGAFVTANSAASFANGAFARANSAYDYANTIAASSAQGAFDRANSAYGQANNAASFANSAFNMANNSVITLTSNNQNQITTNSSMGNIVFGLAATGVVAGSYAYYTNWQVDAYGRMTSTTASSILEPMGNSAYAFANTGYTQANNAASFANGAFTQANNAASFANGAFTAANVSQAIDNTQNTNISSAQSFANGAFTAANIAYGRIQLTANSGDLIANGVNTPVTGNILLGLATTAVSAATYGGASQIPVFTVDTKGRLTYAANVAISIPAGTLIQANTNGALFANGTQGVSQTGTVLLSLANTAVTAGTYGGASQQTIITVDGSGRIIYAANVASAGGGGGGGDSLANTGTSITANGLSVYTFANTTAATANNSGAVTVRGGVSVTGNVVVGSSLLVINSNTNLPGARMVYNATANSIDFIFT